MAKQRVSSTSITGVAPVTIYSDSPDALFLDSSKYRVATNIRTSQYSSSSLLNSDDPNFINPENKLIIEAVNVPHLEDISITANETYLNDLGKSKARITFKINNPDSQKIIDVDILRSDPESGR